MAMKSFIVSCVIFSCQTTPPSMPGVSAAMMNVPGQRNQTSPGQMPAMSQHPPQQMPVVSNTS